MRFEWAEIVPGRYSAVVGDWTLVAWTAALDNAHRGSVQLDGCEVLRARFASIAEAKAAAERWVREYVAPFVEAAQRERDDLRALLDEINREDLGPGEEHGCGSHSCVVERPQGQGNNGGCRCSRGTLRRALRRERERTAAAVEAEREACAAVARDLVDSDVGGYLSLGARAALSSIRARARSAPATLSTEALAAIVEARGLRLVEPEYLAELESAAPPVLRWGYTAAHASEARVAGWHLSAAPRNWTAIHEESGVKVLSPRPNLASEHENRRAVEALIRSLGVPFRTEEDGVK